MSHSEILGAGAPMYLLGGGHIIQPIKAQMLNRGIVVDSVEHVMYFWIACK